MRISDWSSDVCSSDLLVLADAGDAEIAGVGVAEIKARHGRGRQHREMVGQRRTRRVAGVEQLEQDAFQAVFGTGGIAGGRADTAIFLLDDRLGRQLRSEEHTSELQSLMRISYAVFCLKKHKNNTLQ